MAKIVGAITFVFEYALDESVPSIGRFPISAAVRVEGSSRENTRQCPSCPFSYCKIVAVNVKRIPRWNSYSNFFLFLEIKVQSRYDIVDLIEAQVLYTNRPIGIQRVICYNNELDIVKFYGSHSQSIR